MKRQKTFKATTNEEARASAQAWMASSGGAIVYDGPVYGAVLPYRDHEKKYAWEVVVEYDDEEVAAEP
jgi:hypothetical protein